MPIDNQIESNLGEESSGGSPLSNVSSMLEKSIGNLEKAREKKRAILDRAIENLQARLPKPNGPSAEEYFRLAQAFGQPTKAGSFGETIANVAGASAEALGKRKEQENTLQDLMLKYELSGADLDQAYLKDLLSVQKEIGGAQSSYGKVAKDEGLIPGTPQFAKRVKELAQVDVTAKLSKSKEPTLGEFDKKTGNFITSGGTVIKASEVSKDREKIQSLTDLEGRLSDLTPKKLKEAESLIDQTSGIGKALGSRFKTKAYRAQIEIQASGIQEVLNNLPPGPASDKDIAQARSTFPGYSDVQALSQWVERTKTMITRKREQMSNKYGTEDWWGASAIKPKGKDSSARNELGETPAEAERMKNQKKKRVPKYGAVLDNHRYIGDENSDPSDKKNWEPLGESKE